MVTYPTTENPIYSLDKFMLDLTDVAAIGPIESRILEEHVIRYHFVIYFKSGLSMTLRSGDRREVAASHARMRVAWARFRCYELPTEPSGAPEKYPQTPTSSE